MGKNNEGKVTFLFFFISVLTRQTTSMEPVLPLLRVHRPNIMQYMGQRADFYCLSGSMIKIISIINKL